MIGFFRPRFTLRIPLKKNLNPEGTQNYCQTLKMKTKLPYPMEKTQSFFFLFLMVFFYSTLHSARGLAKEEGRLVFEQQQDRFSFAQMTLGYEYNLYNIQAPSLDKVHKEQAGIHNIVLGAWHFWGMSDIYVVFPFKSHESGSRTFSPGVETAFRWYPQPITYNKFRPFIGMGFNFHRYQQHNQAPKKTHMTYPLNAGVSIANNAFQLEGGLRYQLSPSFDYFVSRTQKRTFNAGETSFFIALKRVVDTSIRRRKKTTQRQKKGFYPFVGIGPSSAWITHGENSHFKQRAPWIDNEVSASVFPEFSLGIHWKRDKSLSQRTFFNMSWRNFNQHLKGYGSDYKLSYSALSLEAAQTILDYHGFVPFVGLSYNMVETSISGDTSAKQKDNLIGAFFGWDILPSGSHDSWNLRTNLRWYPHIELTTREKTKVAFPNFEFNFIQWVYQF